MAEQSQVYADGGRTEALTLFGQAVARRTYRSRLLTLSYLEWGDPAAPPLLLLHGGLEHAHAWDHIAQRLCAERRVIVPDLRGHGESDWALGGAYAVLDFTADIAALLHALALEQVAIAGHSLGGTVGLHLAALYPERVSQVCSIEGMRPSIDPVELDDDRVSELRKWSDDLIELAARPVRLFADPGEATARLMAADPRISKERADYVVRRNLRATDEGLRWKYDAQLRQYSALDKISPDPSAFWQRIACPTLLIYGAESWAVNPEKDGRIRHFSNARVVVIADAGHNLHHHQPQAFLDMLLPFLDEER